MTRNCVTGFQPVRGNFRKSRTAGLLRTKHGLKARDTGGQFGFSKVIALVFCLVSVTTGLAQTTQPQESYPPHPDSQPRADVPKGELIRNITFDKSKIFPGTTRQYSIYVPAQYDGTTPACVYVNQDGPDPQYNAPVVFDNLIHKKEMPVTIGIFVRHGAVLPADPNAALNRFNRSFEYDGLGDNYVRFLLEELLPDVEKQKTSDGRAIRLSKSGNDRAIGGSSSGAIAAFTAAWERPKEFTRVFSAIGTYVGLRGGDEYPTLVRKYEPKPIRVFLQDGSNDNNIYAGDWWMANQMMERALVFSGYEVEHIWGQGPHSSLHATAIFPDAVRFLWKDWPKPVAIGNSRNGYLGQILIPGEGWKLVGEGYGQTQGTAANARGEVFFNDVPNRKTYKIGLDGNINVFIADNGGAVGQDFGPDGRLYAVAQAEQKIIAYDPSGKPTTISEGIRFVDLTVTPNGNIYASKPPLTNANDPSELYLIRPGQKPVQVDIDIRYGGGVTLSPDKTFVYVPDHRSHWVYSYQIKPDGTLTNKQQYGHMHVPDNADKSGAFGVRVDRDGRIYIATYMGIQVLDQLGRVNCILPGPGSTTRIWNLCFGGENFDTIYAACGDRIFSRKVKVQGAPAWGAPIKPEPSRL